MFFTEVNLMDHRPSTIAAAATLVALDQQLTIEAVELNMSSIHQYRSLDLVSTTLFSPLNYKKKKPLF